MTQGERGNMNNLEAMKETESIIKSHPLCLYTHQAPSVHGIS